MYGRRTFLQQSALFSLTPLIPGFVAKTVAGEQAEVDQPILVVVEMNGGNDGLNTVVPHRQDGYRRNRPKLRLDPKQLLALDDNLGLNPVMQGFKELFDDGQLAVVGGVGYPNPNRSHFESMAIWHSAMDNGIRTDGSGWLGQSLDQARHRNQGDLDGWFIGSGTISPAMVGRRAQIATVARLQELRLASPGLAQTASGLNDAASSDVAAFVGRTMASTFASVAQVDSIIKQSGSESRFPRTDLGQKLAIISRLIRSGSASRVFYAVQAGYDTHASQLNAHGTLLGELSTSIKALIDDLKTASLADRVVVLAFSEFGRRVQENSSQGTDHGTAGPVFIAGTKVKGGLFGQAPDLSDLESGDLKTSVDFRRVYASLLDGWLKIPSAKVLDQPFETISFI